MASFNNSTVSSTARGSPIAYIAYINGEVVIAALTALGNGFVLAAIIKHRRLQSITNYFVASLAASDFLVGVLGIPCAVVSFVGLHQNYIGCVLVNSMILILTQISLLGLCAVAVERFVAIKYPYRYANSCTGTLCLIVIVVVWLTGIVLCVVPLPIWNKWSSYNGQCSFVAVVDIRQVVYVNFFLCTLVPLVFMFAIYCYIFHVVRQQLRRIEAVQRISTDVSRNVTLKKDSKAAKWFAVVIVLFALSWLPLQLINVVTLYGRPTYEPVLLAAIILSHANSVVNPILYAFANSKFKTAFKNMLHMKETAESEDSLTQETQ